MPQQTSLATRPRKTAPTAGHRPSASPRGIFAAFLRYYFFFFAAAFLAAHLAFIAAAIRARAAGLMVRLPFGFAAGAERMVWTEAPSLLPDRLDV
jgi:hypothetical protein